MKFNFFLSTLINKKQLSYMKNLDPMFKNIFFTIANLAPRDLTLQTGYPHNNGQGGSGLAGVSCMEGQPY